MFSVLSFLPPSQAATIAEIVHLFKESEHVRMKWAEKLLSLSVQSADADADASHKKYLYFERETDD